MQQKVLYLLFLAGFLTAILASCGTKKMLKQAGSYEDAGMYDKASELYYKAHLKKPDKADITIALKRSGQLYLEELSNRVSAAYDEGDYKETVYQYMEARDLVKKLEGAGIYLKPDKTMIQRFEDAKEHYLAGRYQQGEKFIYEKNYAEAKAVFEEIYRIDPDYKETRNYLNQATFEPVYVEGSKLYDQGKYMDAYRKWEYIYHSASGYKDVKERMDQALMERYKEGSLFLANEQFDEAATALGEVYSKDPSFGDVNELYTEARNEPVYRHAVEMLAAGKCRTAYYDCMRIIDDAGSYKDTDKLRDEALACAQYPIAIQTPLIRKNTARAKDFQSLLNSRLLKLNNPFLKIYDLASVDPKLDQVMKNSQGSVNREALKRLHDQNNIKAVLVCNFTVFEVKAGKENKKEKTGFERIVMKSTSGETTFYDKKVKYSEITKENSVDVALTYKLISTETGEILLSDRITQSNEDQTAYAVYNGDKSILYPAIERNGTYSVDSNGYNKLQHLLNRSHEITPVNKLVNDTFKEITRKIAGDINNFDPEK